MDWMIQQCQDVSSLHKAVWSYNIILNQNLSKAFFFFCRDQEVCSKVYMENKKDLKPRLIGGFRMLELL